MFPCHIRTTLRLVETFYGFYTINAIFNGFYGFDTYCFIKTYSSNPQNITLMINLLQFFARYSRIHTGRYAD